MSENREYLLPNMPLSGPVDFKTFVGCATLWGYALGYDGRSAVPTFAVSSLGKYGIQSRFVRRAYGPVVGALCFGGLTAAYAGIHNWRIENRRVDDDAQFNYIGLYGTASGAAIGLIEHPGTTFRQCARCGMIGALLGATFLIPLGIFVQKHAKRCTEGHRLKQNEQGDT